MCEALREHSQLLEDPDALPETMEATQPTCDDDDASDEGLAQAAVPVSEEVWARIIMLSPLARCIQLTAKEAVFGRDKEAVETIDDDRISIKHCKIFQAPDNGVWLLDMSGNGTFVNNQLVGKKNLHKLNNGDEFALLSPTRNADGGPGSKPTCYKYLFNDLRTTAPPRPSPAPNAQLLQGTSFYCANADTASRRAQYREICKLGQGSFAVVKKVVNSSDGNVYAMKVMEKRRVMGQLSGRGRGDDDVKEKLLSEARILKKLNHPNVIKFHDIVEDENDLLLVMELVEGGELFDYVNLHGPFSEAGARGVMCQLLQALQYLHENNVVHRDLKLENILLMAGDGSAPATPLQVKIADFGLAKLVGGGKVTSTFCGTPQYFAPEVLESRNSSRGYDSACDMWSLGVILYILLMGYAPFDESRPQWDTGSAPVPSIFDQIRRGLRDEHFRADHWAKISPSARHLVRKLLVVNPRHRLNCLEALRHPWMRGEFEAADLEEGPTPSTCEEIESCSDGEDDVVRLPLASSAGPSTLKSAKRQKTSGLTMPLQHLHVQQHGRSAQPPPASQPQFKLPLQPVSRPAGSLGPRPARSQLTQHPRGQYKPLRLQ